MYIIHFVLLWRHQTSQGLWPSLSPIRTQFSLMLIFTVITKCFFFTIPYSRHNCPWPQESFVWGSTLCSWPRLVFIGQHSLRPWPISPCFLFVCFAPKLNWPNSLTLNLFCSSLPPCFVPRPFHFLNLTFSVTLYVKLFYKYDSNKHLKDSLNVIFYIPMSNKYKVTDTWATNRFLRYFVTGISMTLWFTNS
jgi:hypothetical protein